MLGLSELQHDALAEIFNQGVGMAAASVSRIVHEGVNMSFPTIAFQTRAAAAQSLGGGVERQICAITQRFRGCFHTTAMLMFPEEKSLEIVRLMVGQAYTTDELTELEQEAMSEIGNIVLNCCMGCLANATNEELPGSLPEYSVQSSLRILELFGGEADSLVLTLKIDFSVERHHIDGYLALLLDMSAMDSLARLLERYINQCRRL